MYCRAHPKGRFQGSSCPSGGGLSISLGDIGKILSIAADAGESAGLMIGGVGLGFACTAATGAAGICFVAGGEIFLAGAAGGVATYEEVKHL